VREWHLHHWHAEPRRSRHSGHDTTHHGLVDLTLMTFAHASYNGTLATSRHGALLGWFGVSSAFDAPDGDGGAARLVAGWSFGAVLGAHAGRLGALGTPRKLTFTPLGPVRDAEASLDDAVGAACHRARAFRGLFFDSVVGYE